MNFVHLPNEMIDHILSYVSYEEIAKLRVVNRFFNNACSYRLNQGFIQVESFHNRCMKDIKTKLPRRESERKSHPLSRHSDIMMALESRMSMLTMTFSKYIECNQCCFIPGKVLDEAMRLLRVVSRSVAAQTGPGPTGPVLPRPHEFLQEFRDISSMAMEYFDEKILPGIRRRSIIDRRKPGCNEKLISRNWLSIQSLPNLTEAAKSAIQSELHPDISIKDVSRKRKREPAFNQKERDNLYRCVENHFAVVESKRTDASSIMVKSFEWDLIAREFNNNQQACSIHTRRDKFALKKCWDKMKKRAKALLESEKIFGKDLSYVAEGRLQMRLNEFKDDYVLEKVYELIKKSQTNGKDVSNNYDPDETVHLESESCDDNADDAGAPTKDSSSADDVQDDHDTQWASYTSPLKKRSRVLSSSIFEKAGLELERIFENARTEVAAGGYQPVLHQPVIRQLGVRQPEPQEVLTLEPTASSLCATGTTSAYSPSCRRPTLQPSEQPAPTDSRSYRRATLQATEQPAPRKHSRLNTSSKVSEEHAKEQHNLTMKLLLLQQQREVEKLKQEEEKTKQEIEKTEQERVKTEMLHLQLQNIKKPFNQNILQ